MFFKTFVTQYQTTLFPPSTLEICSSGLVRSASWLRACNAHGLHERKNYLNVRYNYNIIFLASIRTFLGNEMF